MASPSVARVRVDAQGRMVLPRRLRDEIVTTPGELVVRRTPEGLLLSPISTPGEIETGDDGLPVLRVGRLVRNDEVLDAIDRDRAAR